MKSKKWLTILTFIATLLSLIVAIILTAKGKRGQSFCYDLCLAVFGSALLGFIMSLTEYFVEKRRAMEEFGLQACIVLAELKKARCILLDAPQDLVRNCLQEEYENRYCKYIGSTPKDDAKKKLICYIREGFPSDVQFPDTYDDSLEKMYLGMIGVEKKSIRDAISSYIEAAKGNCGLLDNAYGNLDFLFLNKSTRNKLFNGIYQVLIETHQKLVREEVHFSYYKMGESSWLICVDKAFQMSDYLYEIKTDEYGTRMPWLRNLDKVEKALDDYWKSISNNKEYK